MRLSYRSNTPLLPQEELSKNTELVQQQRDILSHATNLPNIQLYWSSYNRLWGQGGLGMAESRLSSRNSCQNSPTVENKLRHNGKKDVQTKDPTKHKIFKHFPLDCQPMGLGLDQCLRTMYFSQRYFSNYTI